MFVGEAPGKTEDEYGEPFIGDAGRKLDELMSQVGIDPSWCRWTNVVRCIPRAPRGRGVRPPTFDEIDACSDYLEQEILATKPVYIVPLGLTAIKHFLPTVNTVKGARNKRYVVEFPSVRWRYRKFERWAKFKGIEHAKAHSDAQMKKELDRAVRDHNFPEIPVQTFSVWPTYHPAAILRGNYDIEQMMVEDLSYLRMQITGEGMMPVDNYKLLTSLEEIKAHYDMVRDLYRAGKIPGVIYDVETTTLEVFLCPWYELLLFSVCYGKGHVFTVPFNHPESPFWYDKLSLAAIVGMTNEFLEEVPVAGHNIKYDVHASRKEKIRLRKILGDTYLASWTLFNDGSEHGLEVLSTRYTDAVNHKDEMNEAFADVPMYVPLEDRYLPRVTTIPEVELVQSLVDEELTIPKSTLKSAQAKLGLRNATIDEQGRIYRQKNYGDVPLDVLHRYCGSDTDSNWRLHVVFEQMLHDAALHEPHYRLTVPSILPVCDMEWDGIKINKAKFAEAEADYEKRLQDYYTFFEENGYLEEARAVITAKVEAAGKGSVPKEMKLTSTRVKAAILFDVLRFNEVKVSEKTGAPSTDKEVLSTLLNDCLELVGTSKDRNGEYTHRADVLQKMIGFNKDHKIFSSYIRPIPTFADPEDLGHCSFGIRTTDTGRYNAREPSWHIIPTRSMVKSAVEPHHPDGLIEVVDYSQMELRVLAVVTGDEIMLKAFADGKDIHSEMGALVLGKDPGKITKQERRRIKTINFGIAYGRGPASIAAQENMSVDEAREIVEHFFRTFPKIKRWIDSQHSLVHREMEVWTATGFRRSFPDGRFEPDQLERRAVNTPIQGPASDTTADAMIRMHRRLQLFKALQSKMWGFTHDSLSFSIWPGELYEVSLLAQKVMADIPNQTNNWIKTPLVEDYEVGVTWGEMMSMSLLPDRQIRLDGKADYFAKFKHRVLGWMDPPELVSVERYNDEGDDGEIVPMAKSLWVFPQLSQESSQAA
jgi:uracil-DNA glycosylase family 4